ncbi:MAG: TetR/AcrR family transcriptional regulator [Clostridiales bacterium]|nr:TetR/AcrR family transcriptional regulator [Clostridiales bacterium]
MPKIIAQLRGDILSNARQILFSEGYDAFTMRSVAAACHVAVGTVYNYFPSKVMVVAEVILEDWKAALLRMDTPAEGEAPLEGLGRIFEELMVFYDKYAALWKEYAASNTAPLQGAYHLQLVEQLGEKIAAVLAPCAPLCSPVLPEFLAETLLDAVSRGRARFDELTPILKRLL